MSLPVICCSRVIFHEEGLHRVNILYQWIGYLQKSELKEKISINLSKNLEKILDFYPKEKL